MTTQIKARAIEPGAIGRTQQAAGLALPAGALSMYAGGAAPAGWLLCDGAAVSRTTYADLFAAVGTTWGAGNGTTTFNLPDLRGRSPIGAGTGAGLTARALAATGGAESHTLSESEMPLHGHPTRIAVQSAGTASSNTTGGALLNTTGATSYAAHTGAVSNTAGQQVGGTGGGGAHNNMQPFAVVNYIIKT